MRLVRVDEKKYQQQSGADYRAQPSASTDESPAKYDFFADILLPRYSLYIMRNSARFNFTHEILGNKDSQFNGTPIVKDRRISIICRNEPS